MRISSLAAVLALAACHKADPVPPGTAEMAASDDRIACASAGEADLAAKCTVERTAGPDGLVLTLRHPDGHFRRLRVKGDGSGVAAADGAEPARVSMAGAGAIDVAVGGDRYRLPVTVKGGR